MALRYSEITRPAITHTSILSLDNIKKQCRIDTAETDEDANLTVMLKAAVGLAIKHTGIAIGNAAHTFLLDRWPGYDEKNCITIPVWPVVSITSIKYYSGGSWQTLDSSKYNVNVAGKPVQVLITEMPSYDSNVLWPIEVVCVAGYAEASVPDEIKHGCQMLIANWYDNRQEEVQGAPVFQISNGARRLFESVQVAYP